MSENQNRDFSNYDSMTTEALEEILRSHTPSPEGEDSDTELLLYIMGVLANRRKPKEITGKTALESWESFCKNYLEDESSEAAPEQKPSRTAAPWLRNLIAAAAVIVLVVCLPLSVKSFGWRDLLNIFARWTKETFSFVSEESPEGNDPSPDYDGEYASLQDILLKNSRDVYMIPTWIPPEFILDKVEKEITPTKEIYRAFYLRGENELRIRVQNHIATDIQNIEIKEGSSDIYSVSGIDYYISKNADQLQVIWIIDTYECNISGDISIEEAQKMIDSIGKG